MPRMAGIVIPGQPHHVAQRGDNRPDVFFVDDDRRAYLEFLRKHGERFGFNVLGYCLLEVLSGRRGGRDRVLLRTAGSRTLPGRPSVASLRPTEYDSEPGLGSHQSNHETDGRDVRPKDPQPRRRSAQHGAPDNTRRPNARHGQGARGAGARSASLCVGGSRGSAHCFECPERRHVREDRSDLPQAWQSAGGDVGGPRGCPHHPHPVADCRSHYGACGASADLAGPTGRHRPSRQRMRVGRNQSEHHIPGRMDPHVGPGIVRRIKHLRQPRSPSRNPNPGTLAHPGADRSLGTA